MRESYMELKIHISGKDVLILRVPTLWDAVEDQWIGMIRLPISKHLIHAKGKNSFELQNNFNIACHAVFESEKKIADELFSMFKTESEWKE